MRAGELTDIQSYPAWARGLVEDCAEARQGSPALSCHNRTR